MKRLSDYEGAEAIELWADIMTPAAVVLATPGLQEMVGKSKPVEIASFALKAHPEEVIEILTRIDDAPINGLNVIIRIVSLISDIMNNEDAKSFFGMQSQKIEEESSGLHTENTTEEKI